MDFMQAVQKCLNNYANFSGRARRSEFWFFVLFQLACQVVANIIDLALGLGILSLIVSLGLLVPAIAVGVRRLHDIGKVGWWILIGLVPLVGWIILIIFYVKPGDAGPNQFGPDPKAA